MDKSKLLKEVEIRCREANLPLKENAKNLVFGKGNPEAEILFIGEAPGNNEDLQGYPFVGEAGKNLDKLLNKVGLSLEKVYIANVLKYRPPENRPPLEEEIKQHAPWLIEQIRIIQPRVICSLGNYSTKLLLANFDIEKMKNQKGITELHGQIKEMKLNEQKFTLIPLFHPAAIIYNKKLLPLWEKDMQIIKEAIKK